MALLGAGHALTYPESSAPYKLLWSPGLMSTRGLCWHWLAPWLPGPTPPFAP